MTWKHIETQTTSADGRVRASAIVDNLPSGMFKVTVTGMPPHAEQRVYEISARDDNDAAMTGINTFVRAMENRAISANED